ncbi:uncharacterized protein HKW66_Vig0041610 [Vigna angularis]|uniref:Uncharacterized protein n=1 Tax=Phaseolus angularis TaxID=3914 RepID=A0A8T0KYU5_PHAAN|nr:uncharacterized protein HKW66_Vig0041610 [Vigna angularis]
MEPNVIGKRFLLMHPNIVALQTNIVPPKSCCFEDRSLEVAHLLVLKFVDHALDEAIHQNSCARPMTYVLIEDLFDQEEVLVSIDGTLATSLDKPPTPFTLTR